MSGGDQQRVSLGRAMVRRPRVWLMDEPLGTLDADQRMAMRDFLREQQLEAKVTTVYVTHDQEEAMSLADRIVVMRRWADSSGWHAGRSVRSTSGPIRREFRRLAGDEFCRGAH